LRLSKPVCAKMAGMFDRGKVPTGMPAAA
jgi:hypothetical protein